MVLVRRDRTKILAADDTQQDERTRASMPTPKVYMFDEAEQNCPVSFKENDVVCGQTS